MDAGSSLARGVRVLGRIAVAVVVLALPASASAAYPGSNGKIAFVRDNQIWTIDANGAGEAQLTSDPAPSTEPEWSPDGKKILYTRIISCGMPCTHREVRVINADGSGDTHVFGGPPEPDAYSPTWSPDSSTIAFVRLGSAGRPCICTTYNVDLANPDGSNRHTYYTSTDPIVLKDLEWSPKGDEVAFTGDQPDYGYRFVNVKPLGPGDIRNPVPYVQGEIQSVPAWSPDAAKLAYLNDTYPASETEIWSVNSDSTGATQLTHDDVQEFGEEWSPDGTKIVYSGEDPACSAACNGDLFVMNPDGTGVVRLTNTAASETSPDWQPVITTPRPPGYPRPRGATPFRVPLVPAYRQCTVPNRTHGAPLAFSSCAPPSQESSNLTVGTPDANGAAAGMVASLQIQVVPGDAKVSFDVRDVRCYTGVSTSPCGNPNDQAGSDYYGQLTIRLPVRLTDRYNLPAPAGDSPATGDTTMSFIAYCTYSTDTTVGSSCPLKTSAKAWYPGWIATGHRANFELGQVEVLDGGSDGYGTNPQPFLRQGVFVP
jgi:WD40-like Beta Propeller Repeat